MAIDVQRRFRRLVRNMRKASDLSGRLIGSGFVRQRGHDYRLVPAGLFDDVLAYLTRMGGQETSPTPKAERSE